jgi:hypothetical protein
MLANGIHIYQGLCPDEITGPHSRDPQCPCCNALITHRERMTTPVKYYAFAVGLEGDVQDLSDPFGSYEDSCNKVRELFQEYGDDSLYFRATVDADGKLNIDEVSLYELEQEEMSEIEWDDEEYETRSMINDLRNH